MKKHDPKLTTKFIAVPGAIIPTNKLATFVGKGTYLMVASRIYMDFLPQALEICQFVPAPPPHVVGQGLDKIQEGLDLQRKGVSRKKIVVTL
ncbi:hypothetical protein GX51_00655 [Blastomyces parvus]|uniref:Uncharacterized protein n=1 Tax=Blastomyces parvus TaxID=2060905 RepID=A0A2B7XKT3_9EURO|nr:hypothetical protein GX51_00655 [Blastomyces parvus]